MKTKQILAIAAVTLAVITGTITVWASVHQQERAETNPLAEAEYDGEQHEAENIIPNYQVYAQFGLTYDAAADMLTYQGQNVRYFIDQYTVGEDSTATVCEYLNENGTIDLYAERDFTRTEQDADSACDPSGKLVDVKAYTREEFAARDLEILKNPISQGAESGEAMTKDEKAAFYAQYEDFGLIYNQKTDQLIYQGKIVRYFLDIKSSNGKPLGEGSFEGSMNSIMSDENGVLDVYTIRDFNDLNNDGEGRLTGIEPYSQEEFDQRTAEWKADQ